jgi:hypothetical protein
VSAETKPPAPIWCDDTSGMAVWVNGGLIEISDCWARITPDEAAALATEFTKAIEEARGWAARWDGQTRSYYPRPEGVRILRANGDLIECELILSGVTDGVAMWRIATECDFRFHEGDQLYCEKLPDRTGISIPSGYRPDRIDALLGKEG